MAEFDTGPEPEVLQRAIEYRQREAAEEVQLAAQVSALQAENERLRTDLDHWTSGRRRKGILAVESVPDGLHYAAELVRAQGTDGGDEHDQLLRDAGVRLKALTDAAGHLLAEAIVLRADVARLERERDQWKSNAENWENNRDGWHRRALRAETERDEARARANEAARLSAEARDQADDLRRTIADLREQIAIVDESRTDMMVVQLQLERERDEYRAESERLGAQAQHLVNVATAFRAERDEAQRAAEQMGAWTPGEGDAPMPQDLGDDQMSSTQTPICYLGRSTL